MRTKSTKKAERKLAIQKQQLANEKRIAEDLNKPWVNPNPEIKPEIYTHVMDADRGQRMLLQARCMINAIAQLGFSTDDLQAQETPDPQPTFNQFWDGLSLNEQLIMHLAMVESVGHTYNSYAGGMDLDIMVEGALPIMRRIIAKEEEELGLNREQVSRTMEEFYKQHPGERK